MLGRGEHGDVDLDLGPVGRIRDHGLIEGNERLGEAVPRPARSEQVGFLTPDGNYRIRYSTHTASPLNEKGELS